MSEHILFIKMLAIIPTKSTRSNQPKHRGGTIHSRVNTTRWFLFVGGEKTSRSALLRFCFLARSQKLWTSRYDQSMSSRICIFRCTLVVTVLTLMKHRFAGVRIANVSGATREAGSHSPLNRPNELVNHPTHAWSESCLLFAQREAISIYQYMSIELVGNYHHQPDAPARSAQTLCRGALCPFAYHSNTRAKGVHSVCAVIVLACSCHDASVV